MRHRGKHFCRADRNLGQLALTIRQNLLIIPGPAFGGRETRFRIRYATEDRTIDRGVEILRRLARRG